MPAAVIRVYCIWNVFTPQRGNASHLVIVIAAVCSKCKHSEQLDMSWHVSAKVLETCICVWRNNALAANGVRC